MIPSKLPQDCLTPNSDWRFRQHFVILTNQHFKKGGWKTKTLQEAVSQIQNNPSKTGFSDYLGQQ